MQLSSIQERLSNSLLVVFFFQVSLENGKKLSVSLKLHTHGSLLNAQFARGTEKSLTVIQTSHTYDDNSKSPLE